MAERGILMIDGEQIFPIDKKIEDYPISTVFKNPYYRSLLTYRPLGNLSKGYIVLCEDDCYGELMDFTIPLVREYNVPVTFGAMEASPIWNVSGGTEAMHEMVEDYNCEISQHSHFNWAGESGSEIMSEEELNNFFDSEATFFNSLGFSTPESAIYPSGFVNDLVKAVAGARFGVCRNLFSDTISYGSMQYNDKVYKFMQSGNRSNLFCLPSVQIGGIGNDDIIRGAIDYLLANNTIMIVYWHDQSLGTGETWRRWMNTLITYARANDVEFIRLKDIKTIT